MISFGIGHIFYIKAFNTKRGLSVKAAATLALVYLIFLWVIFPNLDDPVKVNFNKAIFEFIDVMVWFQALKIGVPIYGVLLLTMVLYAFSAADSPLKWVTAVSASLFAISDLIIVINMKVGPVKDSQVSHQNHIYSW